MKCIKNIIKHILKSLFMEKPVNLLQPVQPVRNKVFAT